MIETRRLKNVVVFIQTTLSFVLSRKIINIYNNNAQKYGNDENYNENNEQQQLPEGFANSCCNIVSPILLQNLINALPSVCTRSSVEKHFYLLKM